MIKGTHSLGRIDGRQFTNQGIAAGDEHAAATTLPKQEFKNTLEVAQRQLFVFSRMRQDLRAKYRACFIRAQQGNGNLRPINNLGAITGFSHQIAISSVPQHSGQEVLIQLRFNHYINVHPYSGSFTIPEWDDQKPT